MCGSIARPDVLRCNGLTSYYPAYQLTYGPTHLPGAILCLTALGTLPLSLLPSLAALGFTSILGVGALLYLNLHL